ncbi:hypothetical protein SGPA1_30340 [Streptomyces misionensis JCM 4497]
MSGTTVPGRRHAFDSAPAPACYSVAGEPYVTARGVDALLQHRREIIQRCALPLVRALLPQTGHFGEGGFGLLLVHHRVPVEVDSGEPTRDTEIVKRAQSVGQRIAVPVAPAQERRARLLPVASRASRVQFHIDPHAGHHACRNEVLQIHARRPLPTLASGTAASSSPGY